MVRVGLTGTMHAMIFRAGFRWYGKEERKFRDKQSSLMAEWYKCGGEAWTMSGANFSTGGPSLTGGRDDLRFGRDCAYALEPH